MSYRRLKNGWNWWPIPKNALTSISQHVVFRRQDMVPWNGKTFVVIRNPYDRLLSAWADTRLNLHDDVPFNRFARWVCNQDELDIHLADQHIMPEQDLYMDFGRIDQEMARIGIEIDNLNRSSHDPWKSYYTEPLKKRVFKRFEEDFDLWARAVTDADLRFQ